MSVVSSSLKNLSAFLQDHQISFSNGLLVLFTIGGEQIFRFNAFRCPCAQPEAHDYAVVFMLAPALVLFLVGLAVSNLTWRILHGCHYRSEASKNGFWTSLGYLSVASARAAIVPCAWLFVTLLDGNYYACMLSTNPCETKSREYADLIAESQIISWISLGSLVFISLIVICVVRCCDSLTYVQYKFLNSYREAEQKQWDHLMQGCTEKLAEDNVKKFMDEPRLIKKDWDDVSKVPDRRIGAKDEEHSKNLSVATSAEIAVKSGVPRVFLTPLHKWTHLHKSRQQLEQETSPV